MIRFIRFLKEDSDWLGGIRDQNFKSAKAAKKWIMTSVPGVRKLDRGLGNALTRRATVYVTDDIVIRVSNSRDVAYAKFGFWAQKNNSPNLPEIYYHKEISKGITVTVSKRYDVLGDTSDTAKVLRSFTVQMNRNPERELDWLKKNDPSLRDLMRDLAKWSKTEKLRLDLGNINNYMETESGRVIIIDPVA